LALLDQVRTPDPGIRVAMTRITVKLTTNELELLRSLAADQLFRREFIDPRLPGNKENPADLSLGKQLVERLRLMAERAKKERAHAV